MAYILKTLSPVHIHSGEVIKAINYMVKDDKVLIFDEMDIIESVKQQELLNDELLRSFASAGGRRKEYNKTLDYYIDKGIIKESLINKYKLKGNNYAGDLSGQEIYKTMINIQGPYIPGSTIKGVIRTAILYDYLLNKGIEYIKDAVKFVNRVRRFSIDDYIIYGVEDGWLKKDILQDPFKFLVVRDVNMVKKETGIYEETIYNIANFIPGNVIETIQDGNESEQFNFEIRGHEKLIGEYNQEITKYFKDEELRRLLYQYSKDIIEDELEYYKINKHPLFNTKEIIETLEKIKARNSIDSPVLRIGKGKGYKSNTVALAIKKLNKDYYIQNIRNIAKPSRFNKNYEFPKTRKFINPSVSPKLLGFAILEKVDK